MAQRRALPRASRNRVRLFERVRLPWRACVQARRRARPGQGSDGLPRCAGFPAVLGFGSCRTTRFACFAALRSNRVRQVSPRSARVRAPTQSLALQAAPGQQARPFARHKRSPGPFVSLLASSAAPIRPAQAAPGALRANGFPLGAGPCRLLAGPRVVRRRGDCAPPRSAGLLARVRTRTLRHLTRSIGSTIASAASGGRYAAGPEDRASQGTLAQRGQAVGAPAPCRPRARAQAPIR